MIQSFARWPVTDSDIDPGSDMPKPLDQWSAIKASRHQSQDNETAKPSLVAWLLRRQAA